MKKYLDSNGVIIVSETFVFHFDCRLYNIYKTSDLGKDILISNKMHDIEYTLYNKSMCCSLSVRIDSLNRDFFMSLLTVKNEEDFNIICEKFIKLSCIL